MLTGLYLVEVRFTYAHEGRRGEGLISSPHTKYTGKASLIPYLWFSHRNVVLYTLTESAEKGHFVSNLLGPLPGSCCRSAVSMPHMPPSFLPTGLNSSLKSVF